MRGMQRTAVSASVLIGCLLGSLLAQSNVSPQPPEAIASYDRAFKLSLDGKSLEALAEFKRTVILDRTDSYAWFHIGRISAANRDHTLAILAYRNSVYTGRLREDSLALAKEHVRAQMALQREEPFRNENAWSQGSSESQRRAASLEGAGRRQEALEELKRSVILDPNDRNGWFEVGRLSDVLDDRTVAATAFRNALEAGLTGDKAPIAEMGLTRRTSGSDGKLVRGAVISAESTFRQNQPGSGCRDKLDHLASRLADFTYPDLRKQRLVILGTRIADVQASMAQQGISLANGAAMILGQSKEYVRVMEQSKSCTVKSFAGDEAALARALDNRQYDVPVPLSILAGGGTTTVRRMVDDPRGVDMQTSCLRAFVAADMAKIATDETAVQLTCRAASGGR